MRYKVLFTYLLLLVAMSVNGRERKAVQAYGSLSGKSTEWLMEQGRAYFSKRVPDSALVCFSIVSDRYAHSNNAKDKEYAALAFNDLACVWQYFYFDYQEAHNNYMSALKLCEEGGYEKAKAIVSLNLANLLSLYGKGFESKPVSSQAHKLFNQSLEGAYKTENWDLYATAFIDYAENNPEIDLKKYAHLFSPSIPDTIQNLKFARCFYRAIESIQQGDYQQARKWLHQQLEATNAKWLPERYMVQAYLTLAHTHELEHDYANAVKVLKSAEALAEGNDVVDYEISICEKIADCYRLMGNRDMAQAYKIRYLEMKDSVHEANSLVSIGEMNFVHELQQEEMKVHNLMERQERQRNMLFVALIGLAIVLGFAIVLLRAYRLLRSRNKSLYEKNRAVMRAEAEERQLRKDYEQRLQQRDKLLHDMSQEQPSQLPKYSRSSLNDDDKQQLIARIQDVMNDSQVICQQDFTLAKLAKMIGSNTSYVSQAINEKYDLSFSNLLGSFRIKEACRRMDDLANYGNMTIEAISEGAGFRSRVTFLTIFTREIGMTPSEYLKAAKSK